MVSVGPGVVTSIYGNLVGGGHLIHPTVWTVQVSNLYFNYISSLYSTIQFKFDCENKHAREQKLKVTLGMISVIVVMSDSYIFSVQLPC